MKNIDSYSHVRGESEYVDDVPIRVDTLFAVVITSSCAHGEITSFNVENARSSPGVFQILTSVDIPGENQIGGIIPDEELFSTGTVHFIGQPIGLILADSEKNARKSLKLVEITYKELEIITEPREAKDRGLFIHPPRTFETGNIETIWEECDFVVEGQATSGGQEHLYIETQGAYAFPIEGDGVKVISSTQGPTQVQKALARVIGQPMHKVEIDVRRLGGGFGGKEDQATAWGCMAGVAAFITKKPVKIIPDRQEDMLITGKRHPYESDYRIGLDKDGKILGYEVHFYQNSGAVADLSPAVLERTLFHANNCYYIPNLKAVGYPCKTNIPPMTAFRGFGGPQGMFVIESALAKAAEIMNLSKEKLQLINLISDGDLFHYGQIAKHSTITRIWSEAWNMYDFPEIVKQVDEFNLKNSIFKKGVAVMPICFGISFTKTMLNQAGSLVHIYQDGSVGVSTGAVEMGQGVNTRIAQVPIRLFSLPVDKIRIETTNTTRVANTSPSAASATHDLNGMATEIACNKIKQRLEILARELMNTSENTDIQFQNLKVLNDENDHVLEWSNLIIEAYLRRIDLSAHGYFAFPKIHFDPKNEKGEPFAYHSYGVAFIETTVDCLRGNYEIESVKVVHDFGKSMNPIIDLGQMEGGIVQGIGWMTTEELKYDSSGKLLSNALSTYKIPDIYAAPKEIIVHFLEDADNDYGLFKSKAIGEPPLLYGLGVYFAIRNAIKSFNQNSSISFDAPITPEKVLLALYEGKELKKHSDKDELQITN